LPTDLILYRRIMTFSSLIVMVWFSIFFTFPCKQSTIVAVHYEKKSYTRNYLS
jgi:hypothetical protein